MRLGMLLAIAACSQPAVRRDADDVRGGAAIAKRDSTNAWKHSGTLAPGDPVDWVRFDVGVGTKLDIEISVVSEHPGFESDVFAVDGTALGTTRAVTDAAKSSADIRSTWVSAAGPIYVRVAAGARRVDGPYTVVVTRAGISTTSAAECDSHAFDPTNPRCQGECDFKRPDPANKRCCSMWTSCVQAASKKCESAAITWLGDDELELGIGMLDGMITPTTATLRLSKREPIPPDETVARRRMQPIQLSVIANEERRSRWRVEGAKHHDMAHVRAHAERVLVDVPPACD